MGASEHRHWLGCWAGYVLQATCYFTVIATHLHFKPREAVVLLLLCAALKRSRACVGQRAHQSVGGSLSSLFACASLSHQIRCPHPLISGTPAIGSAGMLWRLPIGTSTQHWCELSEITLLCLTMVAVSKTSRRLCLRLLRISGSWDLAAD